MDGEQVEASEACPNDNVLAAYATGTALRAEREQLESHLLDCRACRAAVATAVGHATTQPEGTTLPRPRLRLHRLAASIAAIAAVLLVGWVLFGDRGGSTVKPSTEDLLVSHWRSLAEGHPQDFGSAQPLSRAERLARGGALQRGGIVLVAPAGTTLALRPRIVWRGGRPATVVLSTDAGAPIAQAEGVTSPWHWPADLEPLKPGAAYLLELTVEGVLGPERVSRTFRVASEETNELHKRRVAVVMADVAAPLRSLMLAHVALRADLITLARQHAEDYVTARPNDEVGRETLYRVRTLLGDPAASELLEER